MSRLKLIVALIAISILVGFWYFGGAEYLNLSYLKSQLGFFREQASLNFFQTTAIFAGIYIISTAFSLPGAALLTLLAGAIFGSLWGTIIVSFASTIGATLAFLVTRFLIRDFVQKKFGSKLGAMNEGIRKDAPMYILALRLVPAFPFFVVNLAMGLTKVSVKQFYIFSQIGMLPATFVYVNAGKELSQLESLAGILSPRLLLAFALLGILPFVMKGVTEFLKARKAMAKYKKPKKFDYNMVAIGAGSAGLVTTYIGAAVKAKVAIIEKHKMGGDCLNTGCVPSKALIRTARFLAEQKRSKDFGISSVTTQFNFKEVMERIHQVIAKIEPHDSIERYTSLGAECIQGEAKILSPYEILVNGKTITTKNIVIATGARPREIQFPGLDRSKVVTSDTLWNIKEQPKNLLVLGGGPIGCELAQAFAYLGTKVSIIDLAPRILAKEDEDVAALVTESLKKSGVDIWTNTQIKEFLPSGKVKVAQNDKTTDIEFDLVLMAVGRQANVTGFGLEELGIELTKQGTIEVDEYLRTKYPNIYACGDVAGPYQFTHVAAHQAWYAAVNSLFSPLKKFKADYRVIPWVTFTSPEVARVGLSEAEAKQNNVPYEISHYPIDDLDRAIADSNDHGFVKVLTSPGSDHILGATIVAEHAGEMLPEFTTAMKYKLGLNKILGTIHPYPTMSEANKYVAGVWKKKNAPQKALQFLEKFHTWRRA